MAPGHRPAFTSFSFSSQLTKARLHKPSMKTGPVRFLQRFPTLASAPLFRFMIRQQKRQKANASGRNSFAAADSQTAVQIVAEDFAEGLWRSGSDRGD